MTPSAVPSRWSAIRDRALAKPLARERYDRTRNSVLAIRHVLQAIDGERERAGLSKSDLARRVGTTPAAIRRLFTSPSANPTLRTILDLSDALNLEVSLRPRTGHKRDEHMPVADSTDPGSRG